jgi:hypothetical protein
VRDARRLHECSVHHAPPRGRHPTRLAAALPLRAGCDQVFCRPGERSRDAQVYGGCRGADWRARPVPSTRALPASTPATAPPCLRTSLSTTTRGIQSSGPTRRLTHSQSCRTTCSRRASSASISSSKRKPPLASPHALPRWQLPLLLMPVAMGPRLQRHFPWQPPLLLLPVAMGSKLQQHFRWQRLAALVQDGVRRHGTKGSEMFAPFNPPLAGVPPSIMTRTIEANAASIHEVVIRQHTCASDTLITAHACKYHRCMTAQPAMSRVTS